MGADLERWRGVATFAPCALSLPLASPQRNPAAPHAAGRFFVEAVWRAGGLGVWGALGDSCVPVLCCDDVQAVAATAVQCAGL